jgi:hypothetical protein
MKLFRLLKRRWVRLKIRFGIMPKDQPLTIAEVEHWHKILIEKKNPPTTITNHHV